MGIDTKLSKHPLGNLLLTESLEENSNLLDLKLEYEIKTSANNFESGLPLEDFFRDIMRKLLPNRFAIDSGYIIDSYGNTCGECDVVIYDSVYAAILRNPTTEFSRKKYIPFDAVYAIIEVKQSLEIGILDERGNIKDKPTGSLADIISKCSKFKSLSRNSNIYNKNKEYGILLRIPVESQILNYPYAFGFTYRLGTQNKPVDTVALTNEFTSAAISIGLDKTLDGICINKTGYLGLARYENGKIHQAYPLNYKSNAGRWTSSGIESFEIFFRRVWDSISNVILNPINLIDDYGGNRFIKKKVDFIKCPIIKKDKK